MAARIRHPASQSLVSFVSRPARMPSPAPLAWSTASTTSRSPRGYATAVSASPRLTSLRLPDDYVPPKQPPSARRPEARNSQLLRSYTSLLRSTPLFLIFQHNNLTGVEWAAVRRELKFALDSVSVGLPGAGVVPDEVASHAQLQVIRTRIFDVALRTVEFFDPASVPKAGPAGPSGKPARTYNHDLSKAAHRAVKAATANPELLSDPSSTYAQMSPLLVGPLVLLTFPEVSPAHLAAALRILSPNPPAFPPPTRRKNPGYHDLTTQSGLQKLLLVGGRIEGKVFDQEGVRWVGGIEGGLDGLRAQLVAMLQSAGLGLTGALEGAGKSLWLTMESRRSVLEEGEKGSGASEEAASEETKE